MRIMKKVLAVLVPVLLIGTLTLGIVVSARPTDGPEVSWRMAGDWSCISVQPATAIANTTVNVRSSPTSRPNGWAAGVSRANVIGSLTRGQTVDIVGDGIVRAWVNTDVSRRSDIGYTGPSRWINVRTSDGLEGWVYIAFLDFH